MPFDATRVQDRRLPDGARFDLCVPAGDPPGLLVSILPIAEPDVPRLLPIELCVLCVDFADQHGNLVLAPELAYTSDVRFLVGQAGPAAVGLGRLRGKQRFYQALLQGNGNGSLDLQRLE